MDCTTEKLNISDYAGGGDIRDEITIVWGNAP